MNTNQSTEKACGTRNDVFVTHKSHRGKDHYLQKSEPSLREGTTHMIENKNNPMLRFP
jgi:hypothetical protein